MHRIRFIYTETVRLIDAKLRNFASEEGDPFPFIRRTVLPRPIYPPSETGLSGTAVMGNDRGQGGSNAVDSDLLGEEVEEERPRVSGRFKLKL